MYLCQLIFIDVHIQALAIYILSELCKSCMVLGYYVSGWKAVELLIYKEKMYIENSDENLFIVILEIWYQIES